MSKIFDIQSALRIKLTASVSIVGATTKEIKWKKPNASSGAWSATVEDATTGVIYYDLVTPLGAGDKGYWYFWTYIVFSDGRVASGDPIKKYIYEEGT